LLYLARGNACDVEIVDYTSRELARMPKADKLPAIHPGEILREDFIRPLGLSMNKLALDLHVPVTRVAEIVRELRGITSDTALRLGRYFNTSARFWLNAQAAYDLEVAEEELHQTIERDVHPMTASVEV
jgi:addiction module HigA family antidote